MSASERRETIAPVRQLKSLEATVTALTFDLVKNIDVGSRIHLVDQITQCSTNGNRTDGS